ncbi:shikimate kinase [Spirochaetia bacterium 38H-sp]|uniref:Shikimate kinase n=1 Tax=Rarispira pelagica TaxID=3141764 RepID=A0ABU9UE36_9SPIR
MKNIVLTGLKHAGKSTLGYMIAKTFDTLFYDLDTELERLAYKKTHKILTARQIWKELGEAFFREMELEAAASLAEKNSVVIATGGGIIDNRKALSILKENGIIVYLEEEPAVLFDRIRKGGIPPFLSADNPWESFVALYNKRHSAYKEYADIVLTLSGASPEEAEEMLLQKLKETEYGWEQLW